MLDGGVATRRGVMCSHLEAPYAGMGVGSLPHSEQAHRRCILLPLYPQMTQGDQHEVVDALRLALVAERWAAEGNVGEKTLAQLTREARLALADRLVDTPLDVRDSRGYTYAEVTAGGVPLDEIDARTMESRVCDGLYLVGEILDVDGRLGGFNFQWAWSSAWVAGRALGRTSRVRSVPVGQAR